MVMPGDVGFTWGTNIVTSVANGTIPESQVDDMTERVVASWYLLGQDKDFPAGALLSKGDPLTLTLTRHLTRSQLQCDQSH